MTAYEILAALRRQHQLSPISIYRALEKLIAIGRVHRVESQGAFVLCACEHAGNESNVLAVCAQCGATEEFAVSAFIADINDVSHARGFRSEHLTLELRSICAKCNESGIYSQKSLVDVTL